MNAIRVLTEEHQKLMPFLNQLRRAADQGDDGQLSQALKASRTALNEDLDHHIALEDDTVFPRIAQHLSPDMVLAFIEDHRQIQSARTKLYTASGEDRRSLALTLEELLQDHLAREENMLFPAAENAMSQDELEIETDG